MGVEAREVEREGLKGEGRSEADGEADVSRSELYDERDDEENSEDSRFLPFALFDELHRGIYSMCELTPTMASAFCHPAPTLHYST